MMKILSWPRQLAIYLIKFYQKTLSPDHGLAKSRHPYGFCRFYPTCSEYGRRSFEKYGFWRGGLKTFGRILRCHPWNDGGIDEP